MRGIFLDPYIGEIRIFAGKFAPMGWAFCDGQLLSISENETLFNLIGTTYGGDGQTNFALPDLRGRVPMGPSSSFPIGSHGGVEEVTLVLNQLPNHHHRVLASSQYGESNLPDGNVWAASPIRQFAANAGDFKIDGSFPAGVTDLAGSNQPHNNMMPYLTVSFIISLFGIYPPQA